MSKKRIVASSLGVVLCTLIALTTLNFPLLQVEATQVESEEMTLEEMRESIRQLQALVELLVAMQVQQQEQPAQTPAPAVQQPVQPPVVQQPVQPSVTTSNRNTRPTNPAITRDRAIEITHAELARHGLTGTFRSISMDWERGQWVWEVELRTNSANRWQREFEVYVNVDTGTVVHTEFDD